MAANGAGREIIRTHTCGELRMEHVGKTVTLCGWVQKCRDMNHFCFIDLRDRYGITQIVVDATKQKEMYEEVRSFGREFVVQIFGTVAERSNKNKDRETGEVEVVPTAVKMLNSSKTPPFTIEDKTDGGEDVRMKFRYLDLRRPPMQQRLILRHKTAMCVRNFLSGFNFIEVETPILIKSTPEGARDFVVPSRMNPGMWYALPQSPQTFKQLLMVAGMDRYFQIVRCFRDEELRADRQPEFTQIDCEMAMVDQEDVLNQFEALTKHIFKTIKDVEFDEFPRMLYDDAMRLYGADKPDTRFDMTFKYLTDVVKGKGLTMFDEAEAVIAISIPGLGSWSKKKIKALEKVAKSGEIKGGALIYAQLDKGKIKSSVDKFFKPEDLAQWAEMCEAKDGDMIAVFCGTLDKCRDAMGRFRLYMGKELGLMDPSVYKPLWVIDFPLLEWNEDQERWNSMHHPFTSPYVEHLHLLESDPGKVRARAYDLVINGVEVGGGSIRIHDREMQSLMFKHLGFTPEAAEEQFGFLMRAFEYGAPPHGGMAFGFDRLITLLGEFNSIRDCIAFPKNNMGRDMMIESPSPISDEQLKELSVRIQLESKDAKDEEKKEDEKLVNV